MALLSASGCVFVQQLRHVCGRSAYIPDQAGVYVVRCTIATLVSAAVLIVLLLLVLLLC